MGTATPPNSFIHTIEDVEKATGIKLRALRDYRNDLTEQLDNFCVKGDRGRDYFDNNGMMIFKRIKELADKGRRRGAIIHQIKEEFTGNNRKLDGNTPEPTPQTNPESGKLNIYFERLLTAEKALGNSEAERKIAEERLSSFKDKFLLLESNQQYQEREKRRQFTDVKKIRKEKNILWEQYKNLGWWRGGQKRKIQEEIESLDLKLFNLIETPSQESQQGSQFTPKGVG
jgi:hypothetical protein